MRVVFFLKGATRLDWKVPNPEQFNFGMLVKMIRADGQFLADGVYVQASEIAAMLLDQEQQLVDEDEDRAPNVGVRHPGKVRTLAS